ncbi:MAG: hypothetical protein B9S32_00405 [Verrucomicrobia bacterium Tous-C9LFEB]|nr:MAG: hypothetical protein B9S32_00405 [Verrucomicrobia bacterium Tous-C9LFEB]
MLWVALPFYAGGASAEVPSTNPVAISVPEWGCKMALPSDFRWTGFHGYYYEVCGLDVRLRIHRANPKAKTPEEAIELSAALRRKIKEETPVTNNQRGIPVLLNSEPFRTRSGLYGVKAYFGPERLLKNQADLISYYVGLPSGKVLCICLDRVFIDKNSYGTVTSMETVGEVILRTLEVVPEFGPNKTEN